MKKVAALNDLSGFGKCSLTAAIPVLSALGVQCCPIASAVLTNQTGYPHYHYTDLSAMLPGYIDAWTQNDAHFDGIYTGFMMSSHEIDSFMAFIDKFYEKNTFLLVDPVMGDDGRTYSIYNDELLKSMKRLSRKADLITPNLTEACLLADYSLKDAYADLSKEQLLSFAGEVGTKLRNLAEHNQDVVITGIKCRDASAPCIYNLSVTKEGIMEYRSEFFDKSFSGTGDLFASVVCGCKVRGMPTDESIALAGKFLFKSIEDAVKENVPTAEGVNFEKYIIELIKGVEHIEQE